MAVNYDVDGVGGSEAIIHSEMKVENAVLAYMIFGQDSSTGWTGAVMLTDSRTRPLHFGFATPIKPGNLQRLLYGTTLDEYVKVDVIATKLMGELPRVPNALFVETPDLIAIRRVAQFPVAVLQRQQSTEGAPSLSVVRFSADETNGDNEVVAPLIAALEASVNLVDPFGRMREALKEALKEVQKSTQRSQQA